MRGTYVAEAWMYFCDRLEFAVSYSIVQQFTPDVKPGGCDYSWYILRAVIVMFGVVAWHSNIFARSNSTLIMILQLVLAECFAYLLPIMDANAEDGIILLAHVTLYITLLSAILSRVCAIAQVVPGCADFLHGISPYTILYAVGACLPRLEDAGHLHTSLLVFMCYSAARLNARRNSATALGAGESPTSTAWYLVHFLDYIADRIVMLAFNNTCVNLFGTNTLSFCAAYVAALLALSQSWAVNWPILQTYKTLAAMTLAQQIFGIITIDNNVKFILFAALVLAPGVVCGELTWYGQVAVIGFCISVMDRVDHLIHATASGWAEKAFVSITLIVMLGQLTPVAHVNAAARASNDSKQKFHAAKIGLPIARG